MRTPVDLAQCCIMDVPGNVRSHAPRMTMSTEKVKDPKTIKERVSGAGRCVCQSHKKHGGPACHRAVPVAAIVRLCMALAAMSVEERGYIFYHMYQEERERSGSKRADWSFEGHKMCFTNFCYMLFMSPQTVRELCSTEAGPDGKRISRRHAGLPKGRSGPRDAGRQVDFFFQEYYQSAGEPLPKASRRKSVAALEGITTTYGHTQGACRGEDEDADVMQQIGGKWTPWLNAGDKINKDDDELYNPDRPIVDVAMMCTLAADGQVVGLPVRYVQHGTRWSLYWQFLAHWDALLSSGRVGVSESRRCAFFLNIPPEMVPGMAVLSQVPVDDRACPVRHVLPAPEGDVSEEQLCRPEIRRSEALARAYPADLLRSPDILELEICVEGVSGCPRHHNRFHGQNEVFLATVPVGETTA